MKSVISASRRTDIPAHYLNWFMNKIDEGEVIVQNPFYKRNFTRIDLTPDSVEWIVFWSRNYTNFLKNRSFFDRYRLFFHFTIISHHPLLEKVKISQRKVIRQMEELVKHYGSDHIIWRYDPVVCWEDGGKIVSNYSKSDFELYCHEFSALGLKRCYFSYVSDYTKFKKRFQTKYPGLKILSSDIAEFSPILEEMRKISAYSGIGLFSCCNDANVGFNTEKGRCISGSLLNRLTGKKLVSEAKNPTREDCGCTRSVDIGDYLKQPCHFGCIYCYANPVWE
jgi:hypothetical protein